MINRYSDGGSTGAKVLIVCDDDDYDEEQGKGRRKPFVVLRQEFVSREGISGVITIRSMVIRLLHRYIESLAL